MRWLKGMLEEIKLAVQMTFNASILEMKSNRGWIADRHLRNGYFISLPIFLLPMAWFFVSGLIFTSFPLLFIPAIASSLAWFSYSSWSRERERQNNI